MLNIKKKHHQALGCISFRETIVLTESCRRVWNI